MAFLLESRRYDPGSRDRWSILAESVPKDADGGVGHPVELLLHIVQPERAEVEMLGEPGEQWRLLGVRADVEGRHDAVGVAPDPGPVEENVGNEGGGV